MNQSYRLGRTFAAVAIATYIFTPFLWVTIISATAAIVLVWKGLSE